MAKSRQVTIQFLGDAKGLVSAANSASRSTTTLGDKLKRVGKAAVVGFGAATLVAGKAMYDMAEAAVEDEKSAALLANTLKNTTGATKNQVAAVEDWISKQGELYGVTDDDLRPALSKLATATGDITKAQKLASLAMDVSAGTGKDLQSISLALAKAQNGSLAGLGRLGVATKDASGETKSLADITEDLSKKYSGSAAKAADTAAGKFGRVKVALAETAESIGYKLLPYVNEFGDWLVDKGVPGLEDLARSARRELGPALHDLTDWVGDNKDEFIQLGGTLADDVLPVLKDAGRFAGDAVTFFNKLPAPVKQLGIEAGIAAAILPKLNGAVAGANFSGFVGGLKDSEKRTKALGSAAKSAAGAAGLMALMDSTSRTEGALSTLESVAGGAALGFSMGGPWGALVGGAGGGLIAALRHVAGTTDKTKDSFKVASPEAGNYADQLNKVSGAATNAARHTAALALQQSGAIESGHALGLSSRDLVKYVMGNEGAIRRVNKAIQDADSQTITWTDSLGATHQVLAGNSADAMKLNTALGRNSDAFEKSRKQTQDLAVAGGDLSRALKGIQDRGKIVTAVETKGYPETKRQLAELLSTYSLTPKQITTTMKALGVDGSAAAVQRLIDKINALHDKTVTVTYHQMGSPNRPTKADVAGGAGRTSSGMGNVIQGNFDGTKGTYAEALVNSMNGRRAEIAGSELLNSITRGLKKGERTLKNVMDGLQSYVQTKTDKLNEILSDKSSFVESFRSAFSQSIFSAQFSDAEGNQVPPTLQRMMDFAKQQQANAHSLAANVGSLTSKGLSRDLIQQLISQGQSGYDQIAALATGTAADIAQFNSVNSDTNATLNSLGTDLYNALNPNAQSQIALLNQQIANGQQQVAHLKKIADSLDKDDEIKIKGTDLVILLHKLERATGAKYLVS